MPFATVAPRQTTGPAGCLAHFLVPVVVLSVVAMIGTMLGSALGAPPVQPIEGQASPTPVDLSASPLAPFFTPEVAYWEAAIRRWADRYGLEPNLIATVMQIESCGDPLARSSAGAMGLFQVMPYHFGAGEDPFDPDTNAHRGLKYLRQALRQAQGDVARALAMYNGGPITLSLPPSAWPAETQRYVTWGSGIYADAQAGRTESPTLQRWLAAGGHSLCRQARERLALP